MIEAALLGRLKKAQERYALEALKSPGERSEYDYGFRVGIIEGYERSINELLKMVEEEKFDDRL